MNMNQFTQKSLAAIQGAQDIALEHGNQQIEQPHLLLALVGDGEGFIPQLLTAVGMTVPSFEAAVRAEVDKLPKVSGSGREAGTVYVSQDVDRALQGAGQEAQAMKDEYISVEHILLGLLAHPNAALKELFRTYRLDKEKVMQALARESARQPAGEGLRLRTGSGWVYLTPIARRSALRVIAEGPDLELAAELCDFYAGRAAEVDRSISEHCVQEKDK